jgi:uncharacterized membrane protein
MPTEGLPASHGSTRPAIPRPRTARARYRYGLLLGLITASLAFQLAAPEADWSRLVTVALQGVTLLLALWTSRVRPWFIRIAVVIAALAFVGSIAAVIADGDSGADSITLVTLLLVAVAPIAVMAGVVRNVSEDRGVTLATMFGVLCIYLLLGMFFAFIYGSIEALDSGGVFAELADATQEDFLYFSFTTLTTTGYGDLVVDTGLGRAAAVTEALIGQIYLVTIVAAIVTNLRPRAV